MLKNNAANMVVLKGVKKGEKKSAGFQSYETLLKGQ